MKNQFRSIKIRRYNQWYLFLITLVYAYDCFLIWLVCKKIDNAIESLNRLCEYSSQIKGFLPTVDEIQAASSVRDTCFAMTSSNNLLKGSSKESNIKQDAPVYLSIYKKNLYNRWHRSFVQITDWIQTIRMYKLSCFMYCVWNRQTNKSTSSINRLRVNCGNTIRLFGFSSPYI